MQDKSKLLTEQSVIAPDLLGEFLKEFLQDLVKTGEEALSNPPLDEEKLESAYLSFRKVLTTANSSSLSESLVRAKIGIVKTYFYYERLEIQRFQLAKESFEYVYKLVLNPAKELNLSAELKEIIDAFKKEFFEELRLAFTVEYIPLQYGKNRNASARLETRTATKTKNSLTLTDNNSRINEKQTKKRPLQKESSIDLNQDPSPPTETKKTQKESSAVVSSSNAGPITLPGVEEGFTNSLPMPANVYNQASHSLFPPSWSLERFTFRPSQGPIGFFPPSQFSGHTTHLFRPFEDDPDNNNNNNNNNS